ncbi:MAG: hypothetical protein ABSD38_13545 [Syntrophorhabdales bacterium]|jgi:hypothetical protein
MSDTELTYSSFGDRMGETWRTEQRVVRRFNEELPRQQVASYLTSAPQHSSVSSDFIETTDGTVSLPASGIGPIPVRPIGKVQFGRFVLLQKWEGIVLSLNGDTFKARVNDLVQKGVEEEATIAIDELSETDRDLVEPGAIFYWSIGYHDSLAGQRTRVSLIRFRRLPGWRQKELEAAVSEVESIKTLLDWK